MAGRAHDSPVDQMLRAGITKQDGALVVAPEVLTAIREERIRRASLTEVPSTPKFLNRTHGGAVDKGHGTATSMSLEFLREVRDRSPILIPIHAARHTQVRRLSVEHDGKKTSVGWYAAHQDATDPDVEPPDYIRPHLARLTRMLRRPHPKYAPTLSTVLGGLEEDLLTINRPVIEKIFSLYDREHIVGFRAVDGALIWPTLEWLELWKNQSGLESDTSDNEAMDLASVVLGMDVHAIEYVLVREGVAEAWYPHGKLICAPMQTRTDIRYAGYPPGRVEEAMVAALAFLDSWDYNHSYFTRGFFAEFFLSISSDMPSTKVDAFIDGLRSAAVGKGNEWTPPVLEMPHDGAVTKHDLKAPNKEMMYETWMKLTSALASAVYRMDPSTVNLAPWDGGSSPSLSAPNRSLEIALAKEEGLQGDMSHLATHLLDEIARSCHPELRVRFAYGDYDVKKEAEITEIRLRTITSTNEARLEDGLEPIGFYLDPETRAELGDDNEKVKKHWDNVWNLPGNPTVLNALNQQKMAEQMNGGGDDDGFGGGGFPGGGPPGGPGGDGGQPGGYDGNGSPAPYGTPQAAPQADDQQEMTKGRPSRVVLYDEEDP